VESEVGTAVDAGPEGLLGDGVAERTGGAADRTAVAVAEGVPSSVDS